MHLGIHCNDFLQVFLVEDPTFSERKCFFSNVLDKSLQLPKPKNTSMYHLIKILKLNSFPVDELGNWCHSRLVGGLHKYQAQQGGSMATL